MPTFIPVPSTSIELAVGAASAQIPGLSMVPAAFGPFYILTTDCNLYWAQGANPTATVGAGSALLPAGQSVAVDANNGAKIAVIGDGAATGTCSVSRAKVLR